MTTEEARNKRTHIWGHTGVKWGVVGFLILALATSYGFALQEHADFKRCEDRNESLESTNDIRLANVDLFHRLLVLVPDPATATTPRTPEQIKNAIDFRDAINDAITANSVTIHKSHCGKPWVIF